MYCVKGKCVFEKPMYPFSTKKIPRNYRDIASEYEAEVASDSEDDSEDEDESESENDSEDESESESETESEDESESEVPHRCRASAMASNARPQSLRCAPERAYQGRFGA